MRNGAVDSRRGQAVEVTTNGVRGLRDLTTEQLGELAKETLREYAIRFPRGRPVPMPEGVEIVKSTDLALVAFWMMNGIPLIDVQFNGNQTGARQFGEFVLADSNGNADRLKRDYASSESAKFDSTIRVLKKLTRG